MFPQVKQKYILNQFHPSNFSECKRQSKKSDRNKSYSLNKSKSFKKQMNTISFTKASQDNDDNDSSSQPISRMKTELKNRPKKYRSSIIPQQSSDVINSKISRMQPIYNSKIQNNNNRLALDQKLDHIMKMFEKQQHERVEKNKLLVKKNFFKDQPKYDHTAEEYSKLPKNKAKWNIQKLTSFLLALKDINPFFNKIKDLVSLCLLKIGRVIIFHENEYVQRENYPMTEIGIILWGQVLLKNKGRPMKIYLLPGDSLNQEIIFPNKDKNAYEKLLYSPGIECIKQSGKTKTKAGILFIEESQYRTIFTQLVKVGQRISILTAQNMMMWSYSKKKNIRKVYSHLI